MHRTTILSLLLFLFHLKASYLVSLTKSRKPPQRNNHQNISILLDSLLRGYDNSIRPNFGGKYVIYAGFHLSFFYLFAGPPAIIEVDIVVRSMGPISEMDMVGNIMRS